MSTMRDVLCNMGTLHLRMCEHDGGCEYLLCGKKYWYSRADLNLFVSSCFETLELFTEKWGGEMSLSDKFLVAFLVTWNLMVVAFFMVGLPVWGVVWIVIEIVVVIGEVVAYLKHGRTMTQRFGDWAKQNTKKAIAIITAMVLAWGFLIVHLLM